MSDIHGIKGQTLDITVVGCTKLKNTEIFTRQDPYLLLDYAGTKIRTKTCKDGWKNPSFNNEKHQIILIEGLHELNISVWNSNTFTHDAFIGRGRVQLYKVLSKGYDDSSWMLESNSSKFAGEVQLIMHYSKSPRLKTSLSMPAYPPSPPYPYNNNYYNAPVIQAYNNPSPSPPPMHQVHAQYLNHSSSFNTCQCYDSYMHPPPSPGHYHQPPVYPPPSPPPGYPPAQQPYPPGPYSRYN